MANSLSLEQITAWELEPRPFVDLAASLGCEAVSLFVEAPVPESEGAPFKTDAALRREVKRRLDGSGVRLQTIECFALGPDTQVASFAPALAAGAEMGGKAATAILFDPDRTRTVEHLAALVELAARFDLSVNVEFIARSELPSLAAAVELVREVNAPSLAIVIDSLHWTRSGGTAAELAALDPALVGAIQLCDGPRDMAPELQLFHEGFLQRQIPGEGEFALEDFVRALPSGRTIGVEVPLKNLADRGVPAEERARLAVEMTRRFLGQCGYGN